MAFESSKDSVVEHLCETVTLPRMVRVSQKFDHTHIEPEDIPAVIQQQLGRAEVRERIKPGMRIAITRRDSWKSSEVTT